MANTIQNVKNGQYLQKIADNTFDKIHFETNDGQVKTTAAITIGGHPYSAGTSLATIISALNASGGYQYKLYDAGTLSANGGMLLNLAYSTDNGSTWNEISSDPIVITDAEHANTANSATNADYATSAGSATNANYATSAGSATNATNATNVALTATGGGSASITVKAGNGTAATFTVNNVASATKATQDASGNTITTTYATKTELANVESGVTVAYVTNNTTLTGTSFANLAVTKTSSTQSVTVSALATSTSLPVITGSETATVADLKVGDMVYLTDTNLKDWFIATITANSSNNSKKDITFMAVEADTPSLAGYVTGSSLTANKIVLGNGDSKVKNSTYGITTTSSTNTDTDILTSKATQSAISTALGNHSGIDKVGTVTSVAVSNGGGLAVSGSPVTSSGTITVSHAVPSGASATTLGNSTSRYYIKTITTDAYGHVTGVTTGNETVTNSNTWRNVKVGGSEKLGSGTNTGAVDFVDGTGIAAVWTASGSKISFNLKTSGVTAGTYSAVNVDSYGRVTAGAQMIIFDTEANFASGNYDHLAENGVLITTGA